MRETSLAFDSLGSLQSLVTHDECVRICSILEEGNGSFCHVVHNHIVPFRSVLLVQVELWRIWRILLMLLGVGGLSFSLQVER